jgi:hypothetical protein
MTTEQRNVQEIVQERLSRRDAIRVGIAAATCFFACGCSAFGGESPSEFEQARRELFQILEGLDKGDVQEVRLLTIARRIGSDAGVLLDEQAAFLSDLDRLCCRADVSGSDLQTLADAFAVRRVQLRNDLFGLQDQLRAELSADEWANVAVALNRKALATRIDTPKV